MCKYCVIHKVSKGISAMLPWLVISLVGLWAFSQLLPPSFRYEVTAPQLACLMVLLFCVLWYEILMPKLSSWRARRSAWLRERKRIQEMEMQKLRKIATRRCRNCSSPYRDQNPGGGQFMCSNCGHISKRPVLDVPGSAELGDMKSGIIGVLMGKSGKMLNGKACRETGISNHECIGNVNKVSTSFMGNSTCSSNGGRVYSGRDRCLRDKSTSDVFVSFCKLLSSFLFSIRWVWRKIFGITSREDELLDARQKGQSKKGENGVNSYESKSEKARRKVEEKRQARLERGLLEEEERKQREDVARLVEEQRRLRDEKMEAEKEHVEGSVHDKGKDSKKEAERKRQDRRKEKDKVSNKSNSDSEELEYGAGKEATRNRDFDKKSDNQKTEATQISEAGYNVKVASANNNRVNGTKYLEPIKGSSQSSSKASNGASSTGKGSHASETPGLKATRPNGYIDNTQASVNKRDHSIEHVSRKPNSNGDEKVTAISSQRPVGPAVQPQTTLKKSWHQLFSRSPAFPVPPTNNSNVTSISNMNLTLPSQTSYFSSHVPETNPLNRQIGSGLPLPIILPLFRNGSSSVHSSSTAEQPFSLFGGAPHSLGFEEPEIFEDPCYVPDPVALLGPVSESLDDFSCDRVVGFVGNNLPRKSGSLKSVSASMEVSKPSPIGAPTSRSRVMEDRHTNSGQSPYSPKTLERNSLPSTEPNEGTWKMWDTTPLGQDTLGFVVHADGFEHKRQNAKDMSSKFLVDNQVPSRYHSPQRVWLDNCTDGGKFDPWSSKPIFEQFTGNGESYFTSLAPSFGKSQTESARNSDELESRGNHLQPIIDLSK